MASTNERDGGQEDLLLAHERQAEEHIVTDPGFKRGGMAHYLNGVGDDRDALGDLIEDDPTETPATA